MSDTNVEVVRRMLEAFGRREIGVFLENLDPDVSFFAPTAVLAGHGDQLYRGHAGIHAYFHDVARMWDELHLHPSEYLEGDDGCVVATGAVAGRLKSGEAIDAPAGWAFRFRDGKIVWCRVYTDPSEALADVGLAP
jgi:ketosteroid isomerase-like protein